MRVLVDTCVWSLALRRRRTGTADRKVIATLVELIGELRVDVIGPIRQEVLSGIRDRRQFDKVKARLRSFPDIELDSGDYELAAEYSNRCRSKGVQGSSTDFLICAVANRRHLAVFTVDRDFARFHKILGISLLEQYHRHS